MTIAKRFSLFAFFLVFPVLAFADDVIPTDKFLMQVLDVVKSFGGLSWAARIAALLTLAIALTKVSFLSKLWDKLGAAKVLLAPTLALLAGLVSMVASGTPVTAAGVAAWIFAGAGAIILHELLDGVKAIPGLGDKYVSFITFVESFLGGAK
jgi:cytochrome c oxidase subunit IV